jgi:hypothetical protein
VGFTASPSNIARCASYGQYPACWNPCTTAAQFASTPAAWVTADWHAVARAPVMAAQQVVSLAQLVPVEVVVVVVVFVFVVVLAASLLQVAGWQLELAVHVLIAMTQVWQSAVMAA